jgi:hypothetical protein
MYPIPTTRFVFKRLSDHNLLSHLKHKRILCEEKSSSVPKSVAYPFEEYLSAGGYGKNVGNHSFVVFFSTASFSPANDFVEVSSCSYSRSVFVRYRCISST